MRIMNFFVNTANPEKWEMLVTEQSRPTQWPGRTEDYDDIIVLRGRSAHARFFYSGNGGEIIPESLAWDIAAVVFDNPGLDSIVIWRGSNMSDYSIKTIGLQR